MRNNFSFLNVYKKTKKSEVVTQLLYGDTFKKIKKIGPLIKIKNDSRKTTQKMGKYKLPST